MLPRIYSELRMRLKPWRKTGYAGIRVSHGRGLDGGGIAIEKDWIICLQSMGMPRQPRVFEWCAGPAFIGFSMLAHGLCDSLCLADINPRAVRACRNTVRSNRLRDRVSVYRSDGLDSIPDSERWNLVIGNPPHFDNRHAELRASDEDWRIHERFYSSVEQFLAPNGVVLALENAVGSTPATFTSMIEAGRLRVVHTSTFKSQHIDNIYLLASMRAGDEPPGWLASS